MLCKYDNVSLHYEAKSSILCALTTFVKSEMKYVKETRGHCNHYYLVRKEDLKENQKQLTDDLENQVSTWEGWFQIGNWKVMVIFSDN